jgi:hypothetical protein
MRLLTSPSVVAAIRPAIALALVLATSAIGVGCSNDDDADNPVIPDPRPTPAAALADFATSLANMDVSGYAATLSEGFEFRSEMPGYESLSKAEDVEIVRAMFNEVLDIQIRLDHPEAVPSTYDEFPADEGYMMITVPAARLEIATVRDHGQGPITYLVDGDLCVFVLEETPDDGWRIVMQEAEGYFRSSPRAAIEEWSWPETKTQFMSPELATTRIVSAFMVAMETEDISGLWVTLANAFEFRSVEPGFSPLSRASVLGAMTNMFDEAVTIDGRLDHSGAEPSALAEFPAADGYVTITVPLARLQVETTRDEGSGPITYLVDGDVHLFVLRQSSRGRWQIVMHEDQAGAGLDVRSRTEETTWTDLVDLFR